jgi:hypothetical protein
MTPAKVPTRSQSSRHVFAPCGSPLAGPASGRGGNFSQEFVLAYCAGVIDSDGCIGIKRNTYAVRVIKDSRQPTYSERVEVRQVTPQAVHLLHRLFSGSLYVAKPSLKYGRPLITWSATDRRAAIALRFILPYLRVKKRQAQLCLRLRQLKEESKTARVAFGRGHIGSAPRSRQLSKSMEELYQQIKMLNRVGTRQKAQRRNRA